MATLSERLTKNVPGPFYVDISCIDCDLCRVEAPHFFARDADAGGSYVYRQPETAAEWREAEDALSSCPTDSIGSDGKPVSAETR